MRSGFSHWSLWFAFRRRGPWVTRFTIDGREYGGWYQASRDSRIDLFASAFPGCQRILELGSLEGGHTLALSQLADVKQVVALEGRTDNLKRARFVQQELGFAAEFVHCDLESYDLRQLGEFDAVYCCGLLYHLPKPWELLAKIAQVTDRLFLSTHYSTAEPVPVVEHGIPGQWVGEHGLRDPLSGLSRKSFWPTQLGLYTMLEKVGFTANQVIKIEPEHVNGPLITLSAQNSNSK